MPPDLTTQMPADPAQQEPDGDGAAAGQATNLYDIKTGARIPQDSEDSDRRYSRRATDQLTTSFYEACRAGNLLAARQLMESLECEVARSCGLRGGDWREDGHDVEEVQARYHLEVERASSAAVRPPPLRLAGIEEPETSPLSDAP